MKKKYLYQHTLYIMYVWLCHYLRHRLQVKSYQTMPETEERWRPASSCCLLKARKNSSSSKKKKKRERSWFAEKWKIQEAFNKRRKKNRGKRSKFVTEDDFDELHTIVDMTSLHLQIDNYRSAITYQELPISNYISTITYQQLFCYLLRGLNSQKARISSCTSQGDPQKQ